MIFDSIINRNEFFSDHYLDALVQSDLSGLRGEWDEIEGAGEESARTRVRALRKPFFAAKTAALEASDHAGVPTALHDAVLGALGFDPDRKEVTLIRGGDEEVVVPVAHAADTSIGLLLVVLELGFAADIDAAFDPEDAGYLRAPLVTEGGKSELANPIEAVSYIFATDDPPRFVLLLAGAILVICDRRNWGEGKLLAVDLDLALGRGDSKAKGELETIAALFSSDALVPSEGQSVLDKLATNSHKHAIGVSEDLRDGIRYSVELLANEVVARRKAKNLAALGGGSAKDLAKECLRFLYRLLFLLYAEARPDLKILPTEYPEYAEGYGLDRLRDLALVDLTSQSKDGSHLHDSMDLLFRLVNDGYHHDIAAQQLIYPDGAPPDESHDIRLVFEPLESELFSSRATPLIDEVRLRNEVLQKVLKLLLLSREQKGKERGFVSYAQLGINQLGAVYEKLMAYTGFFADQDLYEVRKPGAKESDGTWVVPVSKADEYSNDVFLTRVDPEGGPPKRVRHEKGSFVFRLSGRDRQRSASYYTPEVLTECVVRHALAELLDQAGVTTPASRLLEFTICEPALGSGAFLNEAINQLAEEYLKRRQAELGETIDPESYSVELQKVKAHLALHQCYGVDLNATAVELAEVSLWLNSMYPGLRAPWFGLHLRRGNSLVGARRAVYSQDMLSKGEWLKALPVDRNLADGPIQDGEIHHFLLPAAGWGAVAGAKQAKELRPKEVSKLRDWRKKITKPPSRIEGDRLVALARRVESLWADASNALRFFDRELYRPIPIFGQPEPEEGRFGSRAAIEKELLRADNALGRLRLVMNAWTALWSWPIDGPNGAPQPPSFAEWLDALEGLLGVEPKVEPTGQMQLFDSLEELHEREEQLSLEFDRLPVDKVVAEHPWLRVVTEIANREGFFHWELEFASIFQRGGFDLQIGNPPWVRPIWTDDLSLAEMDPWFAIEEGPTPKVFADRRTSVLSDPISCDAYLAELAASEGLAGILGSSLFRPWLSGVQTNFYMVFMDETWRHLSVNGVIGLLHPNSHFLDPRGGSLRREAYSRLRRHWHYVNEAQLFEDVLHNIDFGVHVYGAPREVSFLMASNIHLPETVDLSLEHDGSGEVPGMKTKDGAWDRRPHAHRIVKVDAGVLGLFARLFDEEGISDREARLLRPQREEDLSVLGVLASQPLRVANVPHYWATGFHETSAKKTGIIRWETTIPSSWDEVILQGQHFNVATPLAGQPNPGCKNKFDWSDWDLEELPESVVPRTNYQRSSTRDEYDLALDWWEGSKATDYWRLIWRRMVQPGHARTLKSALIPPGPTHVNACCALGMDDLRLLCKVSGLWSSLPFDYLIKVSTKTNLWGDVARRLPIPRSSPYEESLLLRTLRLNCLIHDYEPLWRELFTEDWKRDSWTSEDTRLTNLGDVGKSWTSNTPLRRDVERRQALVEIDALAALMLELSLEQLELIYRTQFPVLAKNEASAYFDANGTKVPTGVIKQWKENGASLDLWPYVLPFDQPNREKEMRIAYEEFSRRQVDGLL
jgi:hypothetical protein